MLFTRLNTEQHRAKCLLMRMRAHTTTDRKMAAPIGSSDMADDDVFGDSKLFEEFSYKTKVHERKESKTENPWETEKADLESEVSKLKQENLRLQAQLKVCIQAKGYKVSEEGQDGPIAQVVYMNHDKVCKYRQEIEKFFEHVVCSQFFDHQANQMEKKYEYTRPLPQCASMVLNEDSDPAKREAFTVTGNVQYYLFFCLDTFGRPLVDGNVEMTEGWEIPLYPIIFREALPVDDKPSAPSKGKRPKASCFNCGNEKHGLRDCPMPRDLVRISQNKKLFMDQMSSSPANTISGRRYHKEGGGQGLEMPDRFKNFKPGVISDALRQALCISSNTLPPYIYAMRLLGYPPGHYLDAQVHKSDLKVYNIKDTDEDGELPSDNEEDGSRQPKFNLKKLIDYPGFNVDADPAVPDEWHKFNSIPMQNNQRKEVLMHHLTPVAATEEDVTPVNKRKNRDFHESSSQKKRRIEQESVDMDISMEYPETPVRGFFQPPLPPTPEVATPPPLPPGSAPPTPIPDSPSASSSQDDSLAWQSANTSLSASRQASQESSRSASPDLDRLMTERTQLLAALEKGGADSVSSSSDAVPSGVDTTEDEEDGEMESSDRTKEKRPIKNGEAGLKDETKNGQHDKVEKMDDASDPDVASKDSPDSPEPQILNSTEWITLDTTGDSSVFLSQDEGDETPNKSGVPHRRNFSVNITPHDFDLDEPKKKGIFQKLLGILKREKK